MDKVCLQSEDCNCRTNNFEYNRSFLYFPPKSPAKEKKLPSFEEQCIRNTEYRNSLTGDFTDVLKKLMADCHITEDKLSDLTGISVRTIARLRNIKYKKYSLDSVLAIIIGLHLPPWVSTVLLNRAYIDLGKEKNGMIYEMIIHLYFMETLEQIREYLKHYGCTLGNSSL